MVCQVRGDEAVCRNGRRIAGELKLSTDGRLRFTSKEAKNSQPFSNILDVRFPEAVPHSTLWGTPLRIGLGKAEWITGELIEINAKTAKVRTVWSEGAILSRSALQAITQLPGWLTVFHENFDSDTIRLKLTKSPTVDKDEHTSGQHGLRLNAAGQSAGRTLPAALEAGRIGVNFHSVGEPTGGRWLVEANFDDKKTVRIILADATDYSVETESGSGDLRRFPRSAGWHRLSIRFRADYLLIGIDNKLLFESDKKWRSQGLRAVRLACVAKPGEEAMRGAVSFDDLAIARPLEELHHENSDPTQDECWLVGGDQLFGQVPRADGKEVEIHGRFGKRMLPWSSLRGFFPKSAAVEPTTSDGAHVRVWLDNGFPQADELEGVLHALDGRKMVLHHPIIGEVTLDRSRLRKLRPLFFGKRIEIDTARHHLGETGQLVPGLFPPRAEGPKLRCRFRLDSVPPTAMLGITAQHSKGTADDTETALKRGDQATELLVNGRSSGNLSSHVDRGRKEPLDIRIVIPTEALLAGENVVEVIQEPESKSGRRASCIISALAIELPR
jgi:hypothetical protein